MKPAQRSRRLLAVLAGLAIGLGGVLATAVPAHADDEFAVPEVEFLDSCDGTYIFLEGGEGVVWSVKAGDEVVFPEAGDTQPEPGEWGVVFLLAAEAGDIEVDYEGSVGEWPSTHEYHYQRECDGLPDPTVTQPNCDVATGKVVIPAPDPQLIGGLEFKLDGEVVEPGSTHNVEPGTHTITLVVDDDALPTVLGAQKVSESVEFPTELVIKTWVIEITAPSCPDLPNTGSRTGLIAGVAVALLIVGSGLLVFGRRRRVTNAG